MQSALESFWFILSYPILLLLSIAGGFFLAQKNYHGKKTLWKPSGTENAVISFYGLLLSFSLYSSGNGYRAHTDLVHQHVDAIASIVRQANLSNDSVDLEVMDWARSILTAKIKSQDTGSEQDIVNASSHNEQLYNGLLQKFAKSNAVDQASLQRYADKIDKAIALDYRIQYDAIERTPVIIIILLVTGSFLVGVLIGFTNGFTDRPQLLVPAIFFLLTTLTVSAILDMDNPSFGIIRPSYNNYRNMLDSLEKIVIKK